MPFKIARPKAVSYSILTRGPSVFRGIDKLTGSHFAKNPMGIVMGDTVYVRSLSNVVDGTGLAFFCYLWKRKARLIF